MRAASLMPPTTGGLHAEAPSPTATLLLDTNHHASRLSRVLALVALTPRAARAHLHVERTFNSVQERTLLGVPGLRSITGDDVSVRWFESTAALRLDVSPAFTGAVMDVTAMLTRTRVIILEHPLPTVPHATGYASTAHITYTAQGVSWTGLYEARETIQTATASWDLLREIAAMR